jgi:DNA end-binding protein Ku
MAASVWSGFISFGLVSFPVRLFAAARAETVHFHMLHRKDLSRVKEVFYCAEENKPIERSEIVRGYEAGKGEYVVVDDDELKNVAPPTASTMDIIQFVRNEEVDPIYFERSYYVAPENDVSKPYALFLKALKETKYDAIAKLSMHGREHVVSIRPSDDGLVLHTLFYPDELNAANKVSVPAKANATRKEMDLAVQLIRQLAGSFKPGEFHDTYRENVRKLIEQKKNGQTVSMQSKPKRAPVIDLMEALKKSLKSPASARTSPSARTARPKSGAPLTAKTARRRKVA